MPPFVPQDVETSEIANNFNATLFGNFFMGIYTAIYCGTIYVYHRKASSKNYLVPVIVTILYLCNLGQFGIQWYLTFPVPFFIALNVLTVVVLILPDVLLIWRCFNLWGRSRRVVVIPALLTFTATALLLIQTVSVVVVPQSDQAAAAIMDHVATAGYIITAFTTLVCTILISYRIHSFSKLQAFSTRRFKHIADIVIQSGAVYSLSLIVCGIAIMVSDLSEDVVLQSNVSITANDRSYLRIYAFLIWTQSNVLFIAGVSATAMVARVCMLADKPNSLPSAHLSGLHIQSRAAPNADMITRTMDIRRLDDGVLIS
ncbi:hypothetical protein BDN70DRAFT_934790 [Pholiota conissans]|uniref:Uncharacterized protein n=1 Tax=Pholiota conissans TaxID=109636 RepID=A0A9P6CXY9_9AGAR|nr:hypothetical protein BDN70DRAFT_934790 [Pholiota conissans]